MYTRKSNQSNDNRINNSIETSVKPLTNEGFSLAIRYATVFTSVTVIVILIVTQVIGLSLVMGFFVSTGLGLVMFVVSLNRAIDLSRIEQSTYSASYENEQGTLQQTLALPQTHEVKLIHEFDSGTGYNKTSYDTLGTSLEALQALSVALMNGKAFNRVTCQEAGISQTQWPTFKDKLLERGYIAQNSNGNKQGYVTTVKGNATFRYLANYSPTLAIGDENE